MNGKIKKKMKGISKNGKILKKEKKKKEKKRKKKRRRRRKKRKKRKKEKRKKTQQIFNCYLIPKNPQDSMIVCCVVGLENKSKRERKGRGERRMKEKKKKEKNKKPPCSIRTKGCLRWLKKKEKGKRNK